VPRALVPALAFAALTGAVVAGLGSPIVLEVAHQTGVSIEAAQWTLTIALVIGVVATPVLSRLGDGHRTRSVLVGSLLGVGVGSAVAALVPSFSGLLVGRALQGLGYAMVPLTVAIARVHLTGRRLAGTLAVLSTSVAVGVGLGNPVMGLVVLVANYRAAFLIALVVAVAGAVWVWRVVPTQRPGDAPVRLDVGGASLLGVGLASTLLAVAKGQSWGWTSPGVVGLGAVGIVALAGWVWVELTHRSPLVDLRLACARGVLGVNLAAVLLGFSVFGGVAAMILLIERPTTDGIGLGHSVFVNGLLMIPMSVATLLSPPVSRWVIRHTGMRFVLPAGSLATAAAFAVFAVAHTATWHIVVAMTLMGFGIGVAYAVMPLLIIERTPPARTASATGINQVLRLMGGSVGAAVVAAVLAAHVPPGHLNPDESGYVAAAVVAVALGLVAAVVAYVMVPADDADRAAEPGPNPAAVSLVT
jgi:MFS family permease